MHTLNLGIPAHVDAGKTSLTERLRFAAGAIAHLGSVDRSDTHSDTLFLERERDIRVQSAVEDVQAQPRVLPRATVAAREAGPRHEPRGAAQPPIRSTSGGALITAGSHLLALALPRTRPIFAGSTARIAEVPAMLTSMPFRPRTRVLIGALFALLPILAGCASAPVANPLPAFAHVAITTHEQLAHDLHADSTAEKAGEGIAGGAVAGAATGALAGLACGPFAPLCSPVLALGGGISGAVAGGVINAHDGLPTATARKVDDVLGRIRQRRDFVAEMRDAVTATVPDVRRSSVDDADALVQVAIDRIDLQQYGHDQVAMRISGYMTVTWNRTQARPSVQRNDYVYETRQDAAERMLQGDGAGFDAGITECITHLAQRMGQDLAMSADTAAPTR